MPTVRQRKERHTRGSGRTNAPRTRKNASISQNSVRLYRGVEQSGRERHTILPVAQDTRHSVDGYTHDRMMRFGRLLWGNVGFVRGAISEIATYSIGSRFQPQFLGQDVEWGKQAERQLESWCQICDIRGQPFNWSRDLWLAVVSALRDGDVLMVFTETENGYPQIQLVPAHKLGSRGDIEVKSGPYKGLPCVNGVVFNKMGRSVAYQVLGDEPEQDRFISARDSVLIYNPEWVDQGRGITALASVINDHVDIDDITAYEKLAAKLFASQALIETHEGDPIGDDAERFTEDQGAESLQLWEDFEGGMVRKFRAGSGSKLEAFMANRPSPNLMQFRRELMRGTYASLQWPIEFAYDASTITSGAVRMVIAKAIRTIEIYQSCIITAAQRAVQYAIAKFMKSKVLPFNEEWYRWGFQLPRKPTVDVGREGKQALEDYKSGLRTAQDIMAEQGLDWREQFDQRIAEAKYLMESAEREGVPLSMIQDNGNNASADKEDDDKKDNEDDK